MSMNTKWDQKKNFWQIGIIIDAAKPQQPSHYAVKHKTTLHYSTFPNIQKTRTEWKVLIIGQTKCRVVMLCRFLSDLMVSKSQISFYWIKFRPINHKNNQKSSKWLALNFQFTSKIFKSLSTFRITLFANFC